MPNAGVEWLPQVISYPAGADLSNSRNLFVKLDASGNPVPVTAVTDRAIGVCRDSGLVTQTVGVWQGFGVVPIKAGGVFAAGDLIGPDATGRAVKLTPGTDTTKYIHGTAQEAATAAGDIVSVAIVIPTAKAA